MDSNWNIRLKQCRLNKGLSLKDLVGINKLDLSQQSLIKYEKGDVFPRINTLEKMCKIYGTTIDYILYGDSKFASFEDRKSSLLVLFLLLYSGKMSFEESGILRILDKKLAFQIRALNDFKSSKDIASIDDLDRLIRGINKLEKEA